MASSVDSFMCSVLCWLVTLATSWGMSSGHWFMGISAQAMPATHCEAELGRYVSVPNVCRTWGGTKQGLGLCGHCALPARFVALHCGHKAFLQAAPRLSSQPGHGCPSGKQAVAVALLPRHTTAWVGRELEDDGAPSPVPTAGPSALISQPHIQHHRLPTAHPDPASAPPGWGTQICGQLFQHPTTLTVRSFFPLTSTHSSPSPPLLYGHGTELQK